MGSNWWAEPVGGDKYYKDINAVVSDLRGWNWKGHWKKRHYAAEKEKFEKDRELQNKEFEQLKGSTAKTVNYGSAITDISNVSGDVLTTEEEQIRAAAALEEEEELLGTRLGMLGGTTLKGLK